MSLEKVSINRLIMFLNRLHNGLRVNSKLASEFCVETTPVISYKKSGATSAAVALSPRALYSNREVTRKEDLERYYTKPGKAEWGC